MIKNLHYLILIATLCLSSLTVRSQSESYKTIYDDPRDIKNLTIHLDPFYADAWLTNITLGFGVRGEFHLGRLASFAFDFRTPYPGTDFQARSHADGGLPYPEREGDLNGLARFFYTEAGAELHIADWTKSKSLRVVLSSYSSGRTTTTTYIMVPGTKRKVFAVRGGFTNIRTAFDIQDAEKSIKAFRGSDTISFGDYGTYKGGGPIYGGYANMTMLIMHGGLSIKSITNLLVSTGSYGQKGNRIYGDLYADVLFAPVISLSDIMTVDKTTWELRSDSLKHIGWRVGYSFKNSDKSFLSYKTELGFRPGYNSKNFFLNFVVGWTIPFDIKIKSDAKKQE